MVYKVAVAGASGYVGAELIRLILMHPQLQLTTLTAHSNAGSKLSEIHPQFAHLDFELVATSASNLVSHDIVFLALPHSASAELASQLGSVPLILDCGADFRLESASQWEKFYNTPHAGNWAYGMPELVLASGGKQRAHLAAAERIAVPGCNVTATTLALAPALLMNLIETSDLVSTMAVGTSGAGRSARVDLLASEVSGSARAYGVGGVHRHVPEMEQNLAKAAGEPVAISFVPILVPMSRGILAVSSGISRSPDLAGAMEVFRRAYADEPFINVLALGEQPVTSSVLGTNRVHLGLALDPSGRLVITSAIDNLVKGTAGAAIQNMNLALGLSETTGLELTGVAP